MRVLLDTNIIMDALQSVPLVHMPSGKNFLFIHNKINHIRHASYIQNFDHIVTGAGFYFIMTHGQQRPKPFGIIATAPNSIVRKTFPQEFQIAPILAADIFYQFVRLMRFKCTGHHITPINKNTTTNAIIIVVAHITIFLDIVLFPWLFHWWKAFVCIFFTACEFSIAQIFE